MVHMNSLPKDYQPQSNDPDFWDVWTLKEKREVNWKAISDDWQQIDTNPQRIMSQEVTCIEDTALEDQEESLPF
jgi:hypothetical protein